MLKYQRIFSMQHRKQLVFGNIHAIWPLSVWTVLHFYTFSLRLLHFLFHIHNNIARSVSFFDFRYEAVVFSAFIYLFFFHLSSCWSIHWIEFSFKLTVHLLLFICIRMFGFHINRRISVLKSFDQNILSFIVRSFEQQNREPNHWIYINSGRET